MLADEGVYLGSESSLARVLREQGQSSHRGRAKKPRAVRPPTTHVATAPRQVWCWDMTYLPAVVIGIWFHLYLILDLYSRKIIGWEVHATDDSRHAAHLVRRTALGVTRNGSPIGPVTLIMFFVVMRRCSALPQVECGCGWASSLTTKSIDLVV